MPASAQLDTWIAESGSWQSFIDFQLPEDERARYSFINQYDNYYLSLMSRTIELLKLENRQEYLQELLAIAKGLEIFSLSEKKTFFKGVNDSNNVLFAAGLYYLSDYPASAWILAKLYERNNYKDDIDKFISAFLKRDLTQENTYIFFLRRYLESGNNKPLNVLIKLIKFRKKKVFDKNIELYFSLMLAEQILLKFKNDNIWATLLETLHKKNHWKDFVRENIRKKVPIWSFFPSQKTALTNGLIHGQTCSLQMPTSSGKTSISELVIYDEFKKNNNCRILYLAPYRALASELRQTLSVCISHYNISSKTLFGGNLPTVEERTSVSEVNLLITTPEKFMAVEDIFPGISEEFTTIICDEGHLLDDESRGLSYELLLSRLKGSEENKKRFIFISAIIPNIAVINSWLGGTDESLASSDYRPTELEYAFLKKMEKIKGYYLDVNPLKLRPYRYQLYKYLSTSEIVLSKNGRGKRTITTKMGISVAAALKASSAGTVALFAPHKRGNSGVEGLALETISQLMNREDFSLSVFSPDGYLETLVEYFTIVFGYNYLLTNCSRLGFIFHHGDFPQNIREIIEDSLRGNKIRLVICTNTLAEGVNLPIKTIVIHSTNRYNKLIGWKRISVRDLKNLVGRAGRAGKETKGLVIIPNSADFRYMRNVMMDNNLEPVKGQLYNIVQIITDYLRRERLQVTTETLDALSNELKTLLDDIDVSMIDLLTEEVKSENLSDLVDDLVRQTLSFYQADINEKKTLSSLFEIRVSKLRPIVEEGKFPILKRSGSNIRLYEQILEQVDFENEIWNASFEALDNAWLDYILDEAVFKLEIYRSDLTTFNEENKSALQNIQIKRVIQLWMGGEWFEGIGIDLDIEIAKVLRLVTSFLSFNIQSKVSAIIRIKELNYPDYVVPNIIANWPSLLQHGLDNLIKLDLTEMGLIDRIAVIQVSNYLDEINFIYSDYDGLKIYLIEFGQQILDAIKNRLPKVSVNYFKEFIPKLNTVNVK
jgi:superfamily II DNA/RNA helicase